MAEIKDFLDAYIRENEQVQTAANLFARYLLPFSDKDITNENVNKIIPPSVQADLYRAAERAQEDRLREISQRETNLTEKENVYFESPTPRAKQDLDLARGLLDKLKNPNVSAVNYEHYENATSPNPENVARRSILGKFYATQNPDGSIRIQDKYDFNRANADTLIQSSNPLAKLQGYAQKTSDFFKSPMGEMISIGARAIPFNFLSKFIAQSIQPYNVDFNVKAPKDVQQEAIRAPQQKSAPVRQTRIQEGETLTSVADRLGTDVQTLARLNKIQNPDIVAAGQLIVGPGQANPISPAKTARDFAQNISRVADPVMQNIRNVAARLAGQETRVSPILSRVMQASKASANARATKKPFEFGVSEFLRGLFKSK